MIDNLYWDLGDPEQGERYHRLAIATTEANNSPIGAAMFKSQLADRLAMYEDYETAEQLLDEAEPIIARERADASSLLMGSRAILYLKMGRLDESGAHLERGLEYYRRPPHRRPDMLATLLMTAGELANRRDMDEEGARLMGASDGLIAEIGLTVNEATRREVERIEAALRSRIPEDRYQRLLANGRTLTIPDAIDLALAVARTRTAGEPGAQEQDPGPAGPSLTRRERDVLRLLADGKPNSAIADALFISERTVTTHLTRLYSKLEVSSRAEAISRALRMGLVESE